MNVLTVVRSPQSTLTDDKDREFELEYNPDEWIDPVVVDNPDGTVTVRYAVQDNSGDWGDPFDDNEGVTFIKFDNGNERNEWILRNLEECSWCGYAEDSAEHKNKVDPDYHPFQTSFEWNDRTFWVERYEHGLVNYALSHESSQVDRQWDVASGVAVLQLDENWNGVPAEIARNLLKEYTSWCNGDCYGIIQEEYTLRNGIWETDSSRLDACWGFVGSEYAEQMVKEGL